MKRIAALTIAVALAFSSFSQSEGKGTAVITSETQIILDNSQPLSATYEADFSHFNFKDEPEAVKFFGYIQDNLTEFEIDFASRKATVILRTDRLKENTWTVSDWNSYFDKVSAYRRPMFKSND